MSTRAISTGAIYRIMNMMGLMMRERRVPWFVSSLRSMDFGANHPMNMHRNIEIMGSRMFVAMLSRKSKKLNPANLM